MHTQNLTSKYLTIVAHGISMESLMVMKYGCSTTKDPERKAQHIAWTLKGKKKKSLKPQARNRSQKKVLYAIFFNSNGILL